MGRTWKASIPVDNRKLKGKKKKKKQSMHLKINILLDEQKSTQR